MVECSQDEVEWLQEVLAQEGNDGQFISVEDSLKAYDTLKSVGAKENTYMQQSMLYNFIRRCSRKVLLETVIPDKAFWSNLVDLVFIIEPLYLVQCLRDVLRAVWNSPEPDKVSNLWLMSNCLSNHDVLVEKVAKNLSTYELSAETINETIAYLSELGKCFLELAKNEPEKCSIMISKYCFLLADTKLFTAISKCITMDTNTQHTIIHDFIPMIRDSQAFMSTTSSSNSITSLKPRLMAALQDTITIDRILDTSDEQLSDISQFSLLQLRDIILLLENSDLSFKKTFSEQLLFGNNPFPFAKAIKNISKQLGNFYDPVSNNLEAMPHLVILILYREEFLYSLMNKLLNIWVKSDSRTEKDLNSLLELITLILTKIFKDIKGSNSDLPQEVLSMALTMINDVDYAKARQWQLDSIKEAQYQNWADHILDFDSMLNNQVNDYVRHQRLLQLQKGAWIYMQNPLDTSIKNPKVSFIVLSDNQQYILIRTFPRKIGENLFVEENAIQLRGENINSSRSKTSMVLLKDVFHFKTQEVTLNSSMPEDFYLVNLVQKNICTEMKLLDKNNNVLLRFFFDTKEDTYIWLDGLQLISTTAKSKREISKDTKEQIETLIGVRKNVQMINLDIPNPIDISSVSSDDEELYDVDTLMNLTSNFYYE